jgi:hypothetical protein
MFEGAGGAEPGVVVGFAVEDVGVTGGERETGVVGADVCVFEGAGGTEAEVALPSFAAEDVGVTGGERESGVVEAEVCMFEGAEPEVIVVGSVVEDVAVAGGG